MGECLLTGKTSRYVTNHIVQLSLSSLWQIMYQPDWLVLRHLCWVAGNTSEMEFFLS